MGAKAKRVCLRVAIIVMLVITVGLAVRAIFNYTTGKRLEKTVAKMKAAGIRLILREFEPACEDQDNAALIWKGVEAMLLTNPGERKVLSKAVEAVFYDRAMSEAMRDKINEILIRNQRTFPLIKEAAQKSCFKHNREWNKLPEMMEMPNAIQLITALRLYGLDSVLKAENGMVEEAIEQCLSGIRLSRKFLDEPFLFSSLVSIALMRQQLVFLKKVITIKDMETDTLTKIMKELDVAPWRDGFARSFAKERALSFDVGIRIIENSEFSDYIDGNWIDRVEYWILRPAIKTEIINQLHFWEKMVPAAQLPYYQTDEIRKEVEEKSRKLPWHAKLTRSLLPNLTTAMFKEANLEANLLAAQVGIACKVYKNERGNYPEKISDLVPDYLDKEPLDPFNGKPFVYQREDSGFIVYSIGSNRKDDEGRGTWNITAIVMEKDDDQAWQERLN